MSRVKLNDVSTGDIVRPVSNINKIHRALNGDLVPRGSFGQPATGQNLGTTALKWHELHVKTLHSGSTSFAVNFDAIGSTDNEVISGPVRTDSKFPNFLIPSGSGNGLSATIDGAPTNIVLLIQGTEYTVTTDLSLNTLTAAPSTNNTALVNDIDLIDLATQRTPGEYIGYRRILNIDTVGTEISSRVGQYHSFSIATAAGTGIFYGRIRSATELDDIRHGYFLDESGVPVSRKAIGDNDVITFLRTGYVFVESDVTTTHITYNNPVRSFTEPTSPITDDFWLDLSTDIWKIYNGASFVNSNATFVGMFVNNTTDCLYSRCELFYANFSRYHNIRLKSKSTTQIIGKSYNMMSRVDSRKIPFHTNELVWDAALDFASSSDTHNTSIQSEEPTWLYITENGITKMSDFEPYFDKERFGHYHPNQAWRAVGVAYNDVNSLSNGPTQMDGDYNRDEFRSSRRYSLSAGVGTIGTLPNYNSFTVNGIVQQQIGPEIGAGDSSFQVRIYKAGIYKVSITVSLTLLFSATDNNSDVGFRVSTSKSPPPSVDNYFSGFFQAGQANFGDQKYGATVIGYFVINEESTTNIFGGLRVETGMTLGAGLNKMAKGEYELQYIGPRPAI